MSSWGSANPYLSGKGASKGKASIPAARPGSIPAARPGSIPAARTTSIPAAKPGSIPAARTSSIPAAKTATIPAGKPATSAVGKPASSPAVSPVLRAQVKKATDLMTTTESAANMAITNAKKIIANPAAPESQVKATMDSLSKNQAKVNETQKTINDVIGDLRKAGVSGVSHVAELQKLLPKIKTLLASINSEKIKITGIAKKHEAETKQFEADVKAKEAKDSKEFKDALPKVKSAWTKLDAAVSKIESSATKLVETPPEGEELTKQQEEVEKAAYEALKQLQELRTDVNTKNTAARQYLPELKKEALKELGQIQQKLNDTQKKLSVYKNFKNHFTARVEAIKAIAEIKQKMDSAVADTTKASTMVKDISKGQMTEEEVAEADKSIALIRESVNSSMSMISSKMHVADSATQDELTKLRKQNSEAKEKLEEVNTRLKFQREAACAPSIIAEAKDKVAKLEACMKACEEAEMPFLKGMEVLPEEESDTALSDSMKAAQECSQALQQARSFIYAKQKAAKEYKNKEVGKSITDQMPDLLSLSDTIERKLKHFQNETAERKINAIMAKAVDSVVDAEKKASAMVSAGKSLALETLDGLDIAAIREAVESVEAAGKEASAACAEVRKVVASKQSQTKGAAGREAVDKVNGRLKVAQDKCDKTKHAIMTAQKLIKAKEILEREGEKLSTAEADVDKAESQTKSGTPTEDGVRIIEEATDSAIKILKVLPAVVKAQIGAAPSCTKEKLQALIERCSKAQEKLEKLNKSTEKERGEVFIKDAEAKASKVEDFLTKVNELELPYLKGIEVLPLDETLENITKSEETTVGAQDAIKETKKFMSAKTMEAKSFADAKVITEAFAKCTERLDATQKKLALFKKETEERKKGAMVQKAGSMVNELEDLVKKVTEASEPFAKEDADKMTEEQAKSPLEKYLEAEKDAKVKLNDVRQFIKDRQIASKGNEAQLESLKKYTTQVSEAQQEMSKAKKTTGVHEQRFLAAHLLEEAKPKFEALDGEVKKATDACAPLLEHGGEEYLVLASIRTLATALTAYAKEKELDIAALFKEASAGKKKVDEGKFVKYLADLPGKINHDEIVFTEERRLAIFKVLDADKDGALVCAEFEAIFKQKGVCKKEISLTASSAIDTETVCKIEPFTELELFGLPKEVDEMHRTECKLADGKTGWVTIKGNQGSAFVSIKIPFDTFTEELREVIGECIGNVNKFQTFLGQKIKEASHHPSGPVTEALTATKGELEKLKPQTNEKLKALETLKKKVHQGMSTFKQKVMAEKTAHIELREKKEAAEITGEAGPKVEALEPLVAKVEEEAKAILETAKDDLAKFAGPATALAAVEKAVAAVLEAAEVAKGVVKEKTQVANEIKPPTKISGLAKKHLSEMTTKLEQLSGKCKKTVTGVKSKCEDIVALFKSQVSKALRVEAQTKLMTIEQFFDDLAKAADMSEATFSKKVQKLEGIEIQPEHAKLLFKNIAKADVLSKRRFLTYVQLYYVTVKDIAFSDVFDVSACKTLRKAAVDEVVEVLEGPKADESSGMVRVRARSLLDSIEGWITVKGNQGTPFLKEVDKVYYCCQKADMPLRKELNDSESIRTLMEEEILELIEGPQKVEVPSVSRGRLKTKDGKIGWITLKNENGVVFAAPNSKLYNCTTSVAMTDGEDVKTCKVIRKLAIGEQFVASGDPVKDPDTGITRLPGKALKDEKSGWITTLGNAGTVYADVDTKKYYVEKDVELQDKLQTAGAKKIKALEVGEVFQLLEAKEDKTPPEHRVKLRCLSDGQIGWVAKAALKKAGTAYKCLEKVPLSDTRAGANVEGSKILRELNRGEMVEILDGPLREGEELRIKCAAKDGLIGWLTLKTTAGKRLLEN